jgi:hypothetical protein
MTRTVFDNSMVAHVWAQRRQDSGKSGNGNFYFEGPFLYSYGSHFLVGYALPDGRALLNSDGYSISTSRHKSYAWGAVRGRSFHVPNLTEFRDVLAGAERDGQRVTGQTPDQEAASMARRVERAAQLISREGVKLAKGQTLNPNTRRPDFSSFSTEAAAVIFEALGLPPAKAARAAAKALKARETNLAQWSKAEADSKTQAALNLAKETAAKPLSETLAQLHQLERSGRLNARFDGPRMEGKARALFAAAKVAKGKGLAKVAAAVMAHYRLIRERVKLWPEIEGPAAVRAELRTAFRVIREARALLSLTPAQLGDAEESRNWYEKPDKLARDARDTLAALGLISMEGKTPVKARAKALARYLGAVGIPESVTAARANELAKALGAMGDRALLAWVRKANRERVAAIRALREAMAGNPAEAPAAVIRAGAKALRDVAHNLDTGRDVMPWKVGLWTAEGARAEYKAAEAILAAAEEREREKAEAELAAWAEARKAAWLAGQPEPARPDSVYAYSSRVSYGAARMEDSEGGALIRARDVIRDGSGMITGGTLETSQGAEVPLTHAIRAFRFLKLCREKGQADPAFDGWRANGKTLPVGHFRVDQVDREGNFRAGCHRINWAEVARLAASLGLDQLTAENTTEPTRGAA